MAQEHDELLERIGKLQTFVKGETFANLLSRDQGLLIGQLGAMTAYLSYLTVRLEIAQS